VAAGPGRDQVKAMRRLSRILAVLSNAGSVGATRDDLIAVAGYGEAAPEDQLGKDLNHLRKQGWQIDNIAPTGHQARYRMVSGDNRLRVRLSPAQRGALQRAVILSQRTDLAKQLGVPPRELPAGVGSEVVPQETTQELSRAMQAVQLRSRIRFTYKGTRRVVRPGKVRFRNYQWYLTGVEDRDDTVKHFAVGRMSAVDLDPPHTAGPVPEVRRIELHPLLWQVDPPTEVTLRTTPDYEPDVVRWLMQPETRYATADAVAMTYVVTNRSAFRARIYVLGPRVTLLGPDEFRAELVAELRAIGGH